MASLVSGFEYDIFISYRQKDNKGERWVSEFVESLKTELESTFKENVSVYFDINPHDGLLETHDVEESLKKKLKCLVFIPIISRTYCDPHCFAWEHEFKVFVSQALTDTYGLKINLPNGNVINRILPVRIHDIEASDVKLCESMIGGALRGVDFVYKTAGVNRPLRMVEENAHDNINKTYYRDQINKVANAIKEIISGIIKPVTHEEKEQTIVPSVIRKKALVKPNVIKVLGLIIVSILFLIFTIHQNPVSSAPTGKSIAVLPFENWFSDQSYAYLGNSIPSQISSELRRVKDLNVIAYNSTKRYNSSDNHSAKDIGKECGANILVLGSISLLNNKKDLDINVQLLNAATGKQVWEHNFPGELDSIQGIGSSIIIKIADQLKVQLSPEEIQRIQAGYTKSSDAYNNFLSGNYQEEATALAMMGKKYEDSTSYEIAIKMYDKAIRYDSTFAMAYARRALSRALAYRSGTMQDKINNEKCRDDAERAIRLNPRLAEAYIAYGMYYYCYKNDYHNALINFNQSSELDPGNWQSLFYSATVYRRMGEWTKSQSLMAKVLKYNPQDALVLTNIAASYCYLRVYDTALIYNDQAIKIMPDWSSPYLNKYQTIILSTGDTREARQLIDTAVKYTGYRFLKEKITLDIYDRNYSAALFKTELSEQDDFGNQGDRLLNYGTIYEYLKRNDLAKTYYDSALVFFNKQLKKTVNPGTCILAAYAYAGSKNYSKAIESARKSIELTDNQLSKSDNLIYLVEIFIRCGEYKEALKKIDDLLKNPSYLSVTKLEIDPLYDPVRNSPEFSMLLNKYRKNE
jgi:TolB-like protein/Tfp pilus assembly protein PilF